MAKRILVVDDDTMNLKRTELILGKQYDVILVESGDQPADAASLALLIYMALGAFFRDAPVSFSIKIKNARKGSLPKIPVIFLTASGYEDDVRTAIELGAVNYLKKPFFPQELLKRVAKEFEKE